MAVYRVQRTRDYTVMSNYHLKDKGLTLKSKGLLSMILSLPEEWNYTTRGLASICKEGVDAIGSALKELETAGYIVRRQLRGANGRITDTEYIIYEQPQPKKLDMLPSDVVSPDTENPDMKKHGHYCKVCGEYKANEKFSGKGHAAHICKSCASLSPEKQAEQMTVNRLLNLPWRLSKEQISWLKNRMKDKRPEVRALAKEQYEMRFPPKRLEDIEDDFIE